MAAVLPDTDMGAERTRADIAEYSWGSITPPHITKMFPLFDTNNTMLWWSILQKTPSVTGELLVYDRLIPPVSTDRV